MDTLTFLDPEEADLVAQDTQGDDYRFEFTVPSQQQEATQPDGRNRRKSQNERDFAEEEETFDIGRSTEEVRRNNVLFSLYQRRDVHHFELGIELGDDPNGWLMYLSGDSLHSNRACPGARTTSSVSTTSICKGEFATTSCSSRRKTTSCCRMPPPHLPPPRRSPSPANTAACTIPPPWCSATSAQSGSAMAGAAPAGPTSSTT